MRRTTSRPVMRSAFLWELNAANGTSATCARDTHRPVSGSRTASVYSIVVQASAAMPPIAAMTFGSMPRGDRVELTDMAEAERPQE